MIDFGEHLPEKKSLDLTPMIDVVFLLLIFFLLTSVFAKPSLPLKVPRAETAQLAAEPALTVAVKADGALLLNNEPVDLDELSTRLRSAYAATSDREISLVSDKGVPFGRVVEVMDQAKKAGAENISVVAERKK